MSSPISAFTAVPNPQMLAFMATQSFLMMQMAGAGWQYGKRKISAMKNQEFNALTVNSLLQKEVADVREAIPTIIKSIEDMTPMVGHIVAQYGDFIKEIIKAMPKVVENIYKSDSPPSLETFNIESIINPLLPAFAEDSATLPPITNESGAYNNKVLGVRNTILNASRSTLIELAKQIPFMGFKANDFKILSDLILKRINQSTKTEKKLPPSTNILPKTKVSKQTLRLQRTKLINEVRRFTAKLVPANARMKTARTRNDRSMLSAAKRELDNATNGLKNARQQLSNFLARWKGVKY